MNEIHQQNIHLLEERRKRHLQDMRQNLTLNLDTFAKRAEPKNRTSRNQFRYDKS